MYKNFLAKNPKKPLNEVHSENTANSDNSGSDKGHIMMANTQNAPALALFFQ